MNDLEALAAYTDYLRSISENREDLTEIEAVKKIPIVGRAARAAFGSLGAAKRRAGEWLQDLPGIGYGALPRMTWKKRHEFTFYPWKSADFKDVIDKWFTSRKNGSSIGRDIAASAAYKNTISQLAHGVEPNDPRVSNEIGSFISSGISGNKDALAGVIARHFNRKYNEVKTALKGLEEKSKKEVEKRSGEIEKGEGEGEEAEVRSAAQAREKAAPKAESLDYEVFNKLLDEAIFEDFQYLLSEARTQIDLFDYDDIRDRIAHDDSADSPIDLLTVAAIESLHKNVTGGPHVSKEEFMTYDPLLKLLRNTAVEATDRIMRNYIVPSLNRKRRALADKLDKVGYKGETPQKEDLLSKVKMLGSENIAHKGVAAKSRLRSSGRVIAITDAPDGVTLYLRADADGKDPVYAYVRLYKPSEIGKLSDDDRKAVVNQWKAAAGLEGAEVKGDSAVFAEKQQAAFTKKVSERSDERFRAKLQPYGGVASSSPPPKSKPPESTSASASPAPEGGESKKPETKKSKVHERKEKGKEEARVTQEEGGIKVSWGSNPSVSIKIDLSKSNNVLEFKDKLNKTREAQQAIGSRKFLDEKAEYKDVIMAQIEIIKKVLSGYELTSDARDILNPVIQKLEKKLEGKKKKKKKEKEAESSIEKTKAAEESAEVSGPITKKDEAVAFLKSILTDEIATYEKKRKELKILLSSEKGEKEQTVIPLRGEKGENRLSIFPPLTGRVRCGANQPAVDTQLKQWLTVITGTPARPDKTQYDKEKLRSLFKHYIHNLYTGKEQEIRDRGSLKGRNVVKKGRGASFEFICPINFGKMGPSEKDELLKSWLKSEGSAEKEKEPAELKL